MSVNNDKILIDEKYLNASQERCCEMSNAELRCRAVANIFAAEIAEKYFQGQSIDIKSGIHNVKEVLADIDISDIYVDGNYIDVRVYFDENELFVPKIHFDYNILPVAYMFIKLDRELTAGEVTGFVFPERINLDNCKDDYYVIEDDMLVSYYDVNSRFVTCSDNGYKTDFEKDAYDFVDGVLSRKEEFYQTLLSSQSAREFLQLVSKSKSVFSKFDFISLTKDGGTDSAKSEGIVSDTESASPEVLESFDESQEFLVSDESEGDVLLEGESYDELTTDVDEEIPVLDGNDEDSISGGDLDEIESYNVEVPVLDESEEIVTSGELKGIESYNDDNAIAEEANATLIEEYEPIELVKESAEEIVKEEVLDNIGNPKSEDSTNTLKLESSNNANNETTNSVALDGNATDDITELSEFDYSTEIMPSIKRIDGENGSDDETPFEVTEEMLNNTNSAVVENKRYEINNSQSSENEQIDKLFNSGNSRVVNASKKKSSIIPLLSVIILLCAAGYYGYTKYSESISPSKLPAESVENIENGSSAKQLDSRQDAMPIETVENIETTKPTEEAASVSIPAIEQNLNASIQVSNLNVNWEVPTGYANNATAKRYFLKVGKVLQLNLKAELLMLSKSPITNKISVELEFNKGTNKFEIKQFVNSSGVSMVDNVVKDTVRKVLEMNMNMNMGVFNSLPGNPVLVINL